MTTFHPFPRLPYELRIQIWKLTVEPRTVEIRVGGFYKDLGPKTKDKPEGEPADRQYVQYLVTPTPVPGPLQTCREARNLGLYQRSMSGLSDLTGDEKQYVWLNLDIDLICFRGGSLEKFNQVAPSVKRLKLESKSEFRHFVNVEEVHVICKNGMREWHGSTADNWWPCSQENLIFIDPRDGLILNGVQMEAKFDAMGRPVIDPLDPTYWGPPIPPIQYE
ncbi:unnamed protein product [Clonostachys byssicola]|uniref:2EXR domain-containing protein n=1 Tax=Clonostachys byssicola TaxID=160290 RepID=A0A9N9UEN2_9HYPO|nr:unnamed protein product [Clonostachys byssicola]